LLRSGKFTRLALSCSGTCHTSWQRDFFNKMKRNARLTLRLGGSAVFSSFELKIAFALASWAEYRPNWA
jgi:hypothetical protein